MPRPLILLLSAALVLVWSASAEAKTRSVSVTVAGNLAGASATAKCKGAEHATGGGLVASPPTNDGGNGAELQPYESRKIGQRSWRVSAVDRAFGTGVSRPMTLTTFAYCDKDAPATKQKQASVPGQAPFVPVSAIASCGSAGKAQAGGFLASSTNASITDLSRQGKKRWQASALRTSAGPPASLTSYAYCADSPAPSARGATIPVSGSPLVHTVFSQKCKQGSTVVAGGFESQDYNPGVTGYYEPFIESVREGKRWRVSARLIGLPATLSSIAYCA